MPLGEWTPVVGILGFGVAAAGFIRGELLRRQSNAVEQRKALEDVEQRLKILELRLTPLFTVFDRRLAELFHQPHPEAWRTDALIDKYRRNPKDLTDEEIEILIRYIYGWYIRSRPGAPEADESKALASSLYLAILDGIRNERTEQRRLTELPTPPVKEPWWLPVYDVLTQWIDGLIVLMDRMDEYLFARRRRRTPPAGTPQKESWWRRFRNYLAGSK